MYIQSVFLDIKKGMKVVGEDGVVGVVVERTDPHNIHVEYEDTWFGLYCLVYGCPTSLQRKLQVVKNVLYITKI